MAAGCLPVVVANQLAGAFASRVPYARFWLRVEQQTFIENPRALIERLRAMPASEVAERRARMLRHLADVAYQLEQTGGMHRPRLEPEAVGMPRARGVAEAEAAIPRPTPGGEGASEDGTARARLLALARGLEQGLLTSVEYADRRARVLDDLVAVRRLGEQTPPALPSRTAEGAPGRGASRLATNFLRAVDEGCLQGAATSVLGHYPARHPYAADDKWGLNCSCLLTPPSFFWCAGQRCTGEAARMKLWTRGRVPTEACRCLHCATLCPTDEETASALAKKAAKGGR